MQDRLPPLDALVTFDAAARHLSFTQAAQERFVTQSAVSRQIAMLEAQLGVQLFRRRHRALDLTDDGARLAAHVARALAELHDGLAALRKARQREVLALTTTPGLASLWLIPRLPSFVAAHPGIDVRIDATHELRPLAADGFDLAVRYGRLDQTHGTPLFTETVQPVCAPSLLKKLPLKKPEDLRHHTLLQVSAASSGGMPIDWQVWTRGCGLPDFEPLATLTFSSYDNAVAAAVDGQGVVLGRRPLVDRLLRARKLLAPLKGDVAGARGYFVIVEPRAARQPAVQALAAWLVEQARLEA